MRILSPVSASILLITIVSLMVILNCLPPENENAHSHVRSNFYKFKRGNTPVELLIMDVFIID